jgi:hypothetical protein
VSRNLDRDTPIKRIADNQARILNEERKPVLPGFWVYIGDFVAVGDPGNDPPYTSPSSPPYQDGVTYAGAPYDYPAFRHGVDGMLEWKGHADVSGATSPAVMCTLPSEWRPTNEFQAAMDVSWPTDLWDGAAFVVARVQIDGTTGDVTLVWPAS